MDEAARTCATNCQMLTPRDLNTSRYDHCFRLRSYFACILEAFVTQRPAPATFGRHRASPPRKVDRTRSRLIGLGPHSARCQPSLTNIEQLWGRSRPTAAQTKISKLGWGSTRTRPTVVQHLRKVPPTAISTTLGPSRQSQRCWPIEVPKRLSCHMLGTASHISAQLWSSSPQTR